MIYWFNINKRKEKQMKKVKIILKRQNVQTSEIYEEVVEFNNDITN